MALILVSVVKEPAMRWFFSLMFFVVFSVGCTETPPWTEAKYTQDYKARIERIIQWAMEEQKKIIEKVELPDTDPENPSHMGPTEEEEISSWWENYPEDPNYYKIYLRATPTDEDTPLYEGTMFMVFEEAEADITHPESPYLPFTTHLDPWSHRNALKGHWPGLTRFYPQTGLEMLKPTDLRDFGITDKNSLKDILQKLEKFDWEAIPGKKILGIPIWAYLGRESGISKRKGFFDYLDERGYHATRFDYDAQRDVGPHSHYVYDRTTNKFLFHTHFCRKCKRDVGENHQCGKTYWDEIWWREVGPETDGPFTRWCRTCRKDVSSLDQMDEKGQRVMRIDTTAYRQILESIIKKSSILPYRWLPPDFGDITAEYGSLPWGHTCGRTWYCKTFLTALPKDPPESRFDYTRLEGKARGVAPSVNPKIADPPKLPWVENRGVRLTQDQRALIEKACSKSQYGPDFTKTTRSVTIKYRENGRIKTETVTKKPYDIMLKWAPKSPASIIEQIEKEYMERDVREGVGPKLRELIYKK